MKKTIALLTVVLFFVFWKSTPQELKKSHPINKLTQNKTHIPFNKLPPTLPVRRELASLTRKVPLPNLRLTFAADTEIKVGNHFIFASDVGAVPKDQYAQRLGFLLTEDKNWSYFKKSPGEASVPVAYHPSKNKFYPVSSIIQVKEVNTNMRENLLGDGFVEYYYIKNIKLLFVESTSEEVLKTYELLKQRGLKAELEVLTERPKAH